MVPRGGSTHGDERGRDSLLSHRHRLAPFREGRIRRSSARCLETIQRSHAIANGCYVAAVNRIGLERPIGGDGLEFWGQSFVAGTSGQLLGKASVDQPENLLVSVDLAKVDVTRTHWPFLRDRRIDAYGDLTRRYRD